MTATPRKFRAVSLTAAELETDILPPGRYFVGDPCYFIEDNRDWDLVVDLLKPGECHALQLEFNDGRKGAIFAAYTANGDGEYTGSDGVKYSVDSSLLGLVETTLRFDEFVPDEDSRIVDAPFGMHAHYSEGQDFIFTVLDENGGTKERIRILTGDTSYRFEF